MPITSSNGLQIVVSPSTSLLSQARVWNGKSIVIEQDKHLRAHVLRQKGEVSTTRLQIPRDDRPISSLAISHSLFIAQILLDNADHFALEFTISLNAVTRMKLIVGTQFKEAESGSTSDGLPLAKLPLIIPRGKWVQVVLHLAGIISSVFNMGPMKCVDALSFCGTSRIAKVFASSDEQAAIDSAPTGMVLFAVPAYAPPIWKTAAPSPPTNTAAGSARAAPQTTYTDASRSPHKPTNPNASGPCGAFPDMGIMGVSLSGSTTSPNKALRGQSVPPRLQPIDPAQSGDAVRPHSESGVAPPTMVNWPSNDAAVRGPSMSLQDQPSLGQVKFIRFVESDDAIQRSQVRGQANQGGNRGVNAADETDISGWEAGDEDAAAAQTDASPNLSPPPPPKSEARVPKQPAKPKNAADERVQRLIASRKRKVDVPATSRRPPRGGSDDEASSPGRRRRLRAKRRMQLMRQNEQRSAKQSALRVAQPSELSLNPNVSNFEEGTTRRLEDGEPLCGYGFGYLGLLHEDGSYETEEGANTHLKGALTLELSGDFDSDE